MRTIRRSLCLAMLTAGIASASHAQQPKLTSCMSQPEARRFDFWVGDWRVTSAAGATVGTSHVEIVSDGCALLENWKSSRGIEGKSLNAWNPRLKQWQQFWVGAFGSVTEYRESTWDGDRSVSFIARTPAADSTPARIDRLTFTRMDDGTVRQHGEASTDGGVTWTTQYDLYYHRAS